jgi:hypothetical protein
MDILILVCALSVAAPDCQKATAQHIFHAPPSDGGMVDCMREGLLYAAQSRLVTPGTYPKIFCRHVERLGHEAEVGTAGAGHP